MGESSTVFSGDKYCLWFGLKGFLLQTEQGILNSELLEEMTREELGELSSIKVFLLVPPSQMFKGPANVVYLRIGSCNHFDMVMLSMSCLF